MDIIILVFVVLIFLEVSFLILRKQLPAKTGTGRKVYLDTSALIDGRIIEIARTGFISGVLFVPRSVTRELQSLADGKDHIKRESARTGMKNIHELERIEDCDVQILEDELDQTPVDERLLELAKSNNGVIVTTDYNLCQVAATEQIQTLNPNLLNAALSVNLPVGAAFDLKIVTEGTGYHQGVGYIQGTMVVVARADKLIGQTVRVVVRRVNSSDSGRIIFADLERPYTRPKTRKSSK